MKRIVLLLVFVVSARSAFGAAAAEAPKKDRIRTLEELSTSFERIADRVSPSVVQIFTSGYSIGPGPWNLMTKHASEGSGVLIDPEGYIVTNAHVVAGVRRIQVQLAGKPDGSGSRGSLLRPRGGRVEARLVGIDVETDLALLKIASTGLPALEFGNSDSLRQGQLVVAFGSPLGLGNTMTMGIVSAVARELKPDDMMVYVQTDAPINPGSSGGPLVDSEGRIVGINTMIVSQSGGNEGVGLAIPGNVVRPIVEQLRRAGKVRRGVVGMQVQTITPLMATALALPQPWGAIVSDLLPEGPAAAAGLRIGDVITAVDAQPIDDIRQLGLLLFRHPTSSKVSLEIRRGSEKSTLLVPVIERSDDPSRFLDLVDPVANLVPELDLLGIDLDDSLRESGEPLRIPTGVVVAGMSSDAAPPGDRFRPGDLLHAVNGKPVRSLKELKAATQGIRDGDPVVVQIERHGRLSFVAFEAD